MSRVRINLYSIVPMLLTWPESDMRTRKSPSLDHSMCGATENQYSPYSYNYTNISNNYLKQKKFSTTQTLWLYDTGYYLQQSSRVIYRAQDSCRNFSYIPIFFLV